MSGRVLQIKSKALMYPLRPPRPPSAIPSSNLPFISRPAISNSFNFARCTRRENKLAALQSRRGRRVLCSRKRGPGGSQMARDETNGRDMEPRGSGIRGGRNGDEARRREWKRRRVILIKAPLSGGKKENSPIKTPSRLRRIHQAEGSSVMSQRWLIYTTGSHTQTKQKKK